MKKNIQNVVKDDLCTGCGTCISFCSKNALSMSLDSNKGIFIPILDEKSCNDCKICLSVCPGHEFDFIHHNNKLFRNIFNDNTVGNYLEFYTGYSSNEKIRFDSSSGGLITQILISALKKGVIDGALVTRMEKDNPLIPEPFIARTQDEIIESSKSKYCPVPVNIALKKILDAPDGEKFAVVGLSCHIQGIRKAEEINPQLKNKILIHLGIVCNHTPNFHATEFILNEYGIKKENINKLNYRGEGWPGGMKIKLNNSKVELIPQFSIKYWGMVFNSFFFPFRCTICNDKSCQMADISFADAWSPEIMKNDHQGTSLIILRIDPEKLIKEMVYNREIVLKIASKKFAMNSQHFFQVKKKVYARINLLRLFRRRIPYYNEESFNSSFNDYLIAILFYLKNYMSNFWPLVRIYLKFYTITFNLKSRLF